LVGAPTLGRYTAFGHHFAKFGKEVFRLDRHPVMSKHPITPMHESDLVEHMTKQTSYSVSNYSVNNIEDAPENYDIPENNYVVYDAVQKEHVTYYGNLLKNNITEKESLFTVGSDRKSTRLNSSHVSISYAVFCLKKKNTESAID